MTRLEDLHTTSSYRPATLDDFMQIAKIYTRVPNTQSTRYTLIHALCTQVDAHLMHMQPTIPPPRQKNKGVDFEAINEYLNGDQEAEVDNDGEPDVVVQNTSVIPLAEVKI